MADEHHDDRGNRQRQQDTNKAKQLTTGENGENNGYGVQTNSITHQHGRHHRAL